LDREIYYIHAEISIDDHLLVGTKKLLDNLRTCRKIEIIEFFGYFCPYCNFFEPFLEEWLSKQNNSIFFRHIPVDFSINSQQHLNSPYISQKKLYFTLRAMGKLQEINKKVFKEIQVLHQQLNTDEAVISFAIKQNLEKAVFVNIYNSFAVKMEVLHSAKLQNAYKVDSVPMLIIDGRYVISPPIINISQGSRNGYASSKSVLRTMDSLVTKILSRKN
jgi:thiol:disulfide interchange protein DsbA